MIPLPDLAIQKAIADFFDRETARIDLSTAAPAIEVIAPDVSEFAADEALIESVDKKITAYPNAKGETAAGQRFENARPGVTIMADSAVRGLIAGFASMGMTPAEFATACMYRVPEPVLGRKRPVFPLSMSV